MKIPKWIQFIIPLAVAIASLIWTFCNNREIRELDAKYKSIELRPILQLSKNPVFIDGQFISTHPIQQYDSNTLSIEGKIIVKQKIIIRNVGNEKAEILAKAVIDTNTTDDFVRQIFFDKSLRTRYFKIDTTTPNRSIEILPNDTYEFDFVMDLDNPKNNKFTIHYFILYRNEYENYYDSYFWLEYDFTEPVFEIIETNKYEIKVKVTKEQILDLFKFSESWSSYHNYYEKDDINKIEKILNWN